MTVDKSKEVTELLITALERDVAASAICMKAARARTKGMTLYGGVGHRVADEEAGADIRAVLGQEFAGRLADHAAWDVVGQHFRAAAAGADA